VKEAEANKEADQKRKDEVDTRNEADQVIFATEKAIKDLGDKVSEDDKKKAEDKIAELKKTMEGSDLEEIKKQKDELNEIAMGLATKVYEEAAKKQQEEAKESEPKAEKKSSKKDKDDNVKEAEYEEK
ncbi:MAG TPA: Hsp70 family protein, partial [Bacilli bacterium]|nr:Hsp70 family protein [Bacilli bacterium]